MGEVEPASLPLSFLKMPKAIFSIADEPTNWDDEDSAGLESFSETDPEDGIPESGSDVLSAPPGPLSEENESPAHEEEDLDLDETAEMISRDEIGSSYKPEPSFVMPPPPSVAPSYPSSAHPTVFEPEGNRSPPPLRTLGSEFELLSEDDWAGEGGTDPPAATSANGVFYGEPEKQEDESADRKGVELRSAKHRRQGPRIRPARRSTSGVSTVVAFEEEDEEWQ